MPFGIFPFSKCSSPTSSSAASEADLRKQVSFLKNYQDATNAVVQKPPTITLRRQITLTHAVQRVYALLNGTEQ